MLLTRASKACGIKAKSQIPKPLGAFGLPLADKPTTRHSPVNSLLRHKVPFEYKKRPKSNTFKCVQFRFNVAGPGFEPTNAGVRGSSAIQKQGKIGQIQPKNQLFSIF